MIHSKSGYTLIEMLITLSILSILLSIPLTTFPRLTQTSQEADLIAKQVQDQFILAQQVAMSTGRHTFIRTDNPNKEFSIRFGLFEEYLIIPYQDPDMTFEFMTISPSTISFLANGHPSRSGTFLLRIGDHRYTFTVYLGKGVVTYKKL